MSDPTQDDPSKDKEDEGKQTTTGSLKNPNKPVVVTYQGESTKKKPDVPPAIKPQTPSHVVGNPVHTEANPVVAKTTTVVGTVIKSSIHNKLPEDILPKTSAVTNTQTPPPVERPTPFSAQTSVGQAPPSLSSQNVAPRAASTGSASGSSPSSAAPQPAPQQSSKQHKGGGSSGIPTFMSLIALCGVAVAMYYAYTSQQQISQIQSQSTDDKTSVQTLADQTQKTLAQINGIQQHNEQDRKVLQNLKAELQNSQQKLVSLSRDSAWVLSEVNYLVFMANERLKVAKDVATAVVQLEQAQSRLQELGDPALLKTQEAIAKDIANLKMLPQVNRQEIWSQLAAISALLSKMPFKDLENSSATSDWMVEKKLPANAPAWEKGLWRSWYEFKGLIKISRQDKNPIAPMLYLQDKAQILHTMQLMCEQAQWAVLHGDEKIYATSLKNLSDWIKLYLGASAQQEQVLAQLNQLSQHSVSVPDLEITQSLQALSGAAKDVKTESTPPPRGVQ